ncbi:MULTISPECIES: ABC transporter permease [unclassified Granulicatella]|jgi:spermidine/putrescine ABC transporter, permease protein|uniref:ABC transporter permease n=1 Tax=unclassified Granulicatella TaxID=2630493 RepID=UPI0025561C5E|nr:MULTISPECIES: ABC transporter permease [unclassified Granulicatella]MDK8381455.1 ABC transporter permease [Granulicatella sp. UMB5615B]MDK8523198.1 ABC transporter permease [Granulicatella sp. UMB5615A]
MKKNVRYTLLFPGVVLLCFFLVLPLLSSLIPTVFPESSFSLQLYIDFFKDSYFMAVLGRTLSISLIVTIFCAVLGLPAAYVISGVSKKWRGILIALTLFPLLTNSVIRSFAWITILGKNGVINNLLMMFGVITEPMSLLYTDFSIIIGSVYLFLPTMIMTLVGVLENIDDDLLEAAATLGLSPLKGFFKIILPLSLPGMIVGSILVFTGTLTAYTTPQLLGGNKKMLLATLLYQRATTLGDWTSASVIALVMIVITFAVMKALNLLAKSMDKRGGDIA